MFGYKKKYKAMVAECNALSLKCFNLLGRNELLRREIDDLNEENVKLKQRLLEWERLAPFLVREEERHD